MCLAANLEGQATVQRDAKKKKCANCDDSICFHEDVPIPVDCNRYTPVALIGIRKGKLEPNSVPDLAEFLLDARFDLIVNNTE